MSRFNNWKSSQMSQSLVSPDSIRIPHERKKENTKQEDQHLPHGLMLQETEDAQNTENQTKEIGEDTAAVEGPSLNKIELQKITNDWKLPIPLGPVCPPLLSLSLGTTKAVGRSWELPPPIAKSFRIHDAHMAHLPPQGPFRHFMDMKVEKRLAGWKEHCSRFGDIDMHKCYQFGQIFSPFQALATMEMRRVVLPRDLAMSSHMQRLDA